MTDLFKELFDLNHDGKMNIYEKAVEYEAFTSTCDGVNENKKTVELKETRFDEDELSFMDEEERREAIEEAGFDPEGYDVDSVEY